MSDSVHNYVHKVLLVDFKMKWIHTLLLLNLLSTRVVDLWPLPSLSSITSSLPTLPPIISPQFWLYRTNPLNRPSFPVSSNEVFIPGPPIRLFHIQPDPNLPDHGAIEFEDEYFDENFRPLIDTNKFKSSSRLVQNSINYDSRPRDNQDNAFNGSDFVKNRKSSRSNDINLEKKLDKSSFNLNKMESELPENQAKSPIEVSRHAFASSNGEVTLVTTMKYPHESTSEYSSLLIPEDQLFTQIPDIRWNTLHDISRPTFESSSNYELHTNNPIIDSSSKPLEEFASWTRKRILPNSHDSKPGGDQPSKSMSSQEVAKKPFNWDEKPINSKNFDHKTLGVGAIVGMVMGSFVCVTLLAGTDHLILLIKF